MLEIASQIAICLLIAALIGFIIGFIIAKSVYTEPAVNEEPEEKETKKDENKQKIKANENTEEIVEVQEKEDQAEIEKAVSEEKEAKENAQAEAGEKPELLEAARNGEKDDLTQIKGIGPKVEEQLNEAGIYHLDQIASWTEANIKWLELNTAFAHRATKDLWVIQAKSFK